MKNQRAQARNIGVWGVILAFLAALIGVSATANPVSAWGNGHICWEGTTYEFDNEPDYYEFLNSHEGATEGDCAPTEHKVWICHVPPGNPANAHAIEVDENGWSGHDGHEGDFLIDGPNDPDCPPPPPDQCPDGSNPGDANGDGVVDESDCNYTPPPAPDWSSDCAEGEWVITAVIGPIHVFPESGSVTLQTGQQTVVSGPAADIYGPGTSDEDFLGTVFRPEGCNPPPDQCPDGSNPGDANGDGVVDESDCNYTPPSSTNPGPSTTQPAPSTTNPGPTTTNPGPSTTQPAPSTTTDIDTPPTHPVLPNTDGSGPGTTAPVALMLLGLIAGILYIVRRRRTVSAS